MPPDLYPQNEIPWLIYQYCQTQLILSPDGRPIYFSIPAFDVLCDLYQVEDRLDCFEKVCFLWAEFHGDKG